MEKNATVIYLPTPEKLTPEQREHWEQKLEAAERDVEHYMRMLGYFAVEKGLEG